MLVSLNLFARPSRGNHPRDFKGCRLPCSLGLQACTFRDHPCYFMLPVTFWGQTCKWVYDIIYRSISLRYLLELAAIACSMVHVLLCSGSSTSGISWSCRAYFDCSSPSLLSVSVACIVLRAPFRGWVCGAQGGIAKSCSSVRKYFQAREGC